MSARSIAAHIAPEWLKRPYRAMRARQLTRTEILEPQIISVPTPVWNQPHFHQYLGDHTVLTETFFRRRIYVDSRDISLAPHIIYDGRWEPWICVFICRSVKPGQTFLDIGANCGFFTILGAHLVGSTGLVVAFEPQPRLHNLLRRSIAINGFTPTTELENVALAAAPGTATMSLVDDYFGSATLDPAAPVGKTIDVQCDTLPAALERVEARRGRKIVPNVIKVDVEGYEYFMWQGARDWFAGLENVTIVMEFSPTRYQNLGQNPAVFIDEMTAAGYRITEMDRMGGERGFSRDDVAAVMDRNDYADLVARKGKV